MISSEKLHTMKKEFYAMLENKTDITEKSYFLYNLSHCPTQQPQILNSIWTYGSQLWEDDIV